METRGIRNNNPANIRKSKDKWQGLADKQPDSSFFTFKSPEWGIRALARVLIAYQDEHGLRTVSKIIKRFAPPVENDTAAYIKAVAKDTGFNPHLNLDLHEYDFMEPLVKAIIKHENGKQPYDDVTINRGLALAGIEPPKKPVTQSRTLKGAQVSAGGTAALAVTDLAEPLAQAQDTLEPLVEYSVWIKAIFLLVVMSGIGLSVYAYMDDRKRRLT